MLKSISKAFRIPDLRKKLLFTIGIIILVRAGSQVPVPGIDTTYFKQWFSQNNSGALNLFSAFTGGSFESFSVFALGITPYITASIIIQLLTIVIPALEEFQHDGVYGMKKLEWINRWTAIGLAFIESIAMALGFGRSGLIPNLSFLRGVIIVICLTAGSGLLIFMGEMIKKKGIGNGISIILAVNILSRVPHSLSLLFENFVYRKTIAKGMLAAATILGVILITIILVVLLNEGRRDISVQYSGKMSGHKMIGGQMSKIPIKVNVANVMPVIFTSTILSIPQMVATITGKGYGSGVSAFILNCVSQNNWFDPLHPQYTFGFVIYVVMMYFFAFFYTSISFNPMEIADNLKKQGGCIAGIRPGKPTEIYIGKIINRMIVIGTTGLLVVVMIPCVFNGMFGASVSFGGTSIIIIVGVILETLEQIESFMQERNFSGFILSDTRSIRLKRTKGKRNMRMV